MTELLPVLHLYTAICLHCINELVILTLFGYRSFNAVLTINIMLLRYIIVNSLSIICEEQSYLLTNSTTLYL